jgi:hypothetical protein
MGPVVVVVLSHRAPAQVRRLVERISTGTRTVALIHHDPGGEPLDLKPSDQVVVVPDPVRPRWGRLSLVEAQWRALHWIRANIPDFSWVLLISGQDYPLLRMSDIENELAASPYDAYLRHFQVDLDPSEDVHPWQPQTRDRYLYRRRIPFSHRSVSLPFPRRHPFRDGVGLYVGDMWFNLSSTATEAILDERELSDRLLRYLRRSPIPDETFIAGMTLNARPRLAVADDSRRFISWLGRSPHPEVITTAHLDRIAASDAFFARKIDAELHPEVPDLLDDLAARRSVRAGATRHRPDGLPQDLQIEGE